jgi:hypothetical protein
VRVLSGFTKTSPNQLEISYLVCFFMSIQTTPRLVEIAIMMLVCPSMTARCFWYCTSAVRLGYGSAAKTKTTSSLHEACLAYSTAVHLFFFCLIGVLLLTGDPMCLVSPRNGDPFLREKSSYVFFCKVPSNRVQVQPDPDSACQWHTPFSSFFRGRPI